MERCKKEQCNGIIVKEVTAFRKTNIGSAWYMITPVAKAKRTYVRKCINCGTHYREEAEV